MYNYFVRFYNEKGIKINGITENINIKPLSQRYALRCEPLTQLSA